MALNGIGGGDAGSALERFQALRDSAKKKLAGEDGQAGLAELIKRKQAELGAGIASRPSAERIPPKPDALPASGASGQAARGAAISGAYGRGGAAAKQDPKPTLGRHVDFMA